MGIGLSVSGLFAYTTCRLASIFLEVCGDACHRKKNVIAFRNKKSLFSSLSLVFLPVFATVVFAVFSYTDSSNYVLYGDTDLRQRKGKVCDSS